MGYRRLRRIWPLAVAALLLLAPAQSSFARLYKWVDEDGNVTYSERKPPDAQAEVVKVRKAPVTREQAEDALDSLKEKANEQQKDRETAKTIAKENKQEADAFKKNCEIARQNRQVLENSARVQGKDGDGNNYYLDQNEIQSKLEQASRQIELYCK